ncbi:hypothetical protein BMS3Bbin02_00096 [bacterium BMS3Bbin02]|nr:hypothetical protein BMS3Bbin02_00096 [bacterium BMS3Bbin02]
MEHLTIVAAYFNQPEIFEEWWRVLLSYPDELVAKIKLRLVDDHSERAPLGIPATILKRFDVQAFVVEDDIVCGQTGARNLAMKHAEGWCFVTDPDYILYPDAAQKLLGKMSLASGRDRWMGELERRNYYHPRSKLYGTGKEQHRAENMAVVHADDFWSVGGYNEDFAGGYGYGDGLLFRAMKEYGKMRDVFIQDVWMTHYQKGVVEKSDGTRITDAASPIVRSTVRNKPIFKRMNSDILTKGWKRLLRDRKPPIRFKWRRFA